MTTATYIDTLCSGCGKRLRVAGEHAGKQARCPHCQATYIVPPHSTVTAAGAAIPQAAPIPASDSWQLKTPEGLVYGPVSKAELDRWCQEGRITPKSQLLAAGDGQWRWAEEIYPQVASALLMAPMTTSGSASSAVGASNGAAAARAPYPSSYYASGIQPHRGALVLILSILGLTTLCAAWSVIAVALGWHDLRLMKEGKMEPGGRGLTIAGIVLGIVWIVGFTVFAVLWGLVVSGVV